MTTSALKPQVHGIFDAATCTVTYVVHNGTGSAAAIIDSVLNYDPKSERTRTTSAHKVIDYVKANDLKGQWILETHAHADHLSAAQYLKKALGGKIAIGDQIPHASTSVLATCLLRRPTAPPYQDPYQRPVSVSGVYFFKARISRCTPQPISP